MEEKEEKGTDRERGGGVKVGSDIWFSVHSLTPLLLALSERDDVDGKLLACGPIGAVG